MQKLKTNKSSAVAEMGDRLATIEDMGRKVGASLPLSRAELGPHPIQCRNSENPRDMRNDKSCRSQNVNETVSLPSS